MKRFIAGILASVFVVASSAAAAGSTHNNSTNNNVVQQGVEYGATNLQIKTTATANTTTTVYQTSQPRTVTSGSDTNNAKGIYAALGDSVAAGAGLSGATGGDSRCGQTSQGYPNIVAQKRGMQLINASCSGATVGDIVTKQGISGPNISSQLDQAFANGTPQLITITAGANDMQWLQFIKKCAQGTCGTSADTTATQTLRAAMDVKYRYALDQISARSNGTPPRVVITGYYNPVSNYCKGRQSYVSNTEIDWLNNQRDLLNKQIRSLTKDYKNVRYASTNFDGHTICAKEPWSQGLNEPSPLHPNAKGQEMIAKSVLSKIN